MGKCSVDNIINDVSRTWPIYQRDTHSL